MENEAASTAAMKVLIVDDDKNVVNGLKTLIPWETIGYRVVGTATNGKAGLEQALRENPDVIISDIVMPEMDGTDFLRNVMSAMSDVAFIFLSAYEDFPAAQLAIQYHVKGYILKPIDRQKLHTLIEYLIEIRESSTKSDFYRAQLFEEGSGLKQAIANHDRTYFEDLFRRMLDDTLKFIDDVGLVRSTCERLAAEMQDKWGSAFHMQPEADLRAMKKKMDLILAVADACYAYIEQDNSAHPMIADVRRLIAAHLGQEELSLEWIAGEMNYSPSYVSRTFQRYVGMSITDYITMQRMEQASALLTSTRLSVAEVARQSGFHNPNYFTQVFKKTVGCLPTEYRANYRKSQE